MKSFREFLAENYAGKDSPEGDFADDYARDISTKDSDRHNDLELLLSHLRLKRACHEALVVGKSLHRKWRKKCATPSGGHICAIDPGIGGAILVTDGVKFLEAHAMPLLDVAVSFDGIHQLLGDLEFRFKIDHIFLERAIPMAMGAKGAFSYGRGFEAIVIAISLRKAPMTMVEPSRWTREMHEGISHDLKPKAKSLQAARRLFPGLLPLLPTKPKGGFHDGMVDALLLAGYGLRKLGSISKVNGDVGDFY
jgi:hypothetical protein